MPFYTKTLNLTFETPEVSTNASKAVTKYATMHVAARLQKIAPFVKVLRTTVGTAVSNLISVQGKLYNAYMVTFTVDVEAPATDIAARAIESCFDTKTKTTRFQLLVKKVT